MCDDALLDEVIGKLGAAAIQIIPSDDQIIADHVRTSVAMLLRYRHMARKAHDELAEQLKHARDKLANTLAASGAGAYEIAAECDPYDAALAKARGEKNATRDRC